MQTENKIALGSDPMRAKNEIDETDVPRRAEKTRWSKNRSRHGLIADKLARIPGRTPRMHEIAGTTTQQNERERRKERQGRQIKKGAETDGRVVKITEKANGDGHWLLLSVMLVVVVCDGIVACM